MKPNKTISILLTMIILLETLIPSFQNIVYGVEEIIEEVESQNKEDIEAANENINEEVKSLEINAVQYEENISKETEISEEVVVEEQEEKKEENKIEEKITSEKEIEGENVFIQKDEIVGEKVDSIYLANTTGMAGSGTSSSPYIITTASQLDDIRNGLTAYYKLGDNIDLSSYSSWTAIGKSSASFTGVLDGAGYSISNLKSSKGLFGHNEGIIKNIKLENVNVSGDYSVGGLVGNNVGTIQNSYVTGNARASTGQVGVLVGKNEGTIEKCYTTGVVYGKEYEIGGLVGRNSSSASITNCFSTVKVTASDANKIGGLVGYNLGNVSNCYAIGKVSGGTYAGSLGGLIGSASGSASVINSYWTPETTIISVSSGGEKVLVVQMQFESICVDWNFEQVWAIGDGEKKTLPYLKDMPIPDTIYMENLTYIEFESGDGSEQNPFIIVTPEQLNAVRNCMEAHYKLGANINLEAYKKWEPIGDKTTPFKGSFDGAKYIISNLKINSTDSYMGLFGYNIGNLKNIKLEEISVDGGTYTGSLVGYNSGGHIENCYAKGTLIGNQYVGGLIGYNVEGMIENSYTDVTLKGDKDTVGGLVGRLETGRIVNCYSSGSVTGSDSNIGGLVGYNKEGIVENSYTTGSVTGKTDNIGGLIGDNLGRIEKCYTTGTVTNENSTVGGLVGRNTGIIEKCYTTGVITGKSVVGGLVGSTSSSSSIVNCFATGSVIGESYYNTGSLVGSNQALVMNCYGIGNVITGDIKETGGLIGTSSLDSSVINSYWAPETTNKFGSEGGESTFLFLMQYQTRYKDWDFDEIWAIGDGEKGTLAYIKDLPIPESIYIKKLDPVVFENGDGSEENPFIIVTPRQLEAMNYCLYENYKLGKDINLINYENWLPIGDISYKFSGSLDGDEYKISNLKITDENDYKGLFGYNLGKIKNVKLENIDIRGKKYVGGLLGYNELGIIENSYVSGIITGSDANIGGLVGYNKGGTIENSYASGTITGNASYTGGLVGYNDVGTIQKCYTEGKVIGNSTYVGGLVGYNKDNIILCYSNAKVNGNDRYIGGFVGWNIGVIEKCYATGEVVGSSDNVGGLIGYNKGGVSNCYATGDISGSTYVGSFIGYNYNNVNNCYGIGKVTITGTGTNSKVGGLIGSAVSSAKTTNSYWPPETVEQEISAGGEMTTIARMYKESSYTDWDFEEIWIIDDDSIAYLRELPKPESVKILDPNELKPKNVSVKHIEETLGYSSATFEITAADYTRGIKKFDLYIDNEIVKTITYDTVQLGKKTETITIDGIKGNADIHEYYVIATNSEDFNRKSDYSRFSLKPISVVLISSNNTEFTNKNLEITMEANLAEGHIIEYKTSLDSRENNWKKYITPFEIIENQIIYARVNDGINCGVESEYVVNNIDKLKPEFTGTYSRRLLTLNLKDVGTSGVKSYQYVILSESPDKVNIDLKYSEEILVTEEERIWKNGVPTDEFEVKINVQNTESNYVYVKAFDNAGNFETLSFGEYYIPGNIVNIEVEAVSEVNEDIKLGGAKFELKVNNPYPAELAQSITTNNDGLAKFQIRSREEGEYSYILSELQAPKGYEKINNSALKIQYNYYGEVLNVTSLSANVVVEKVESQLIKLKILNPKELGPEYQVAVKAVDEYDEETLLNDLVYRIEVQSERGSNVSYSGRTGIRNSGFAILDGLRGSGEIVIKIKAISGISGYIFDETKEYTLVINRDEETEEIIVNLQKTDFDVEYEIDYKHRTIIIIDKNRPKEIQSKLVVNLQNKLLDENRNISGLEVNLEQPYGLGIVSSKTDEMGNVVFNNIISLPEGEYLYKLFIKGMEKIEAKEIHLKVKYNDKNSIIKIEELTKELTSISFSYKEDEIKIYKIYNLNLIYEVEYEYFDLKIQERDRIEGFALNGIKYKIKSSLASTTIVTSKTTDIFGEILTSIIKQDQVTINILETSMISGYVLEPIVKTLVLDLNKETNFMEVNEELTDDNLDVEIEPNTGRIIIKETSVKKKELKDKANICFFISKMDNNESKLGGVEFKFQEEVTGLDTILVTDKNGKVEFHDFKVSEVGTYKFILTEIKTLPGYEKWKNPIILNITYELVNDEFTATQIIIEKGYENIIYKYCDEYETQTEYQLDVYLDLMNQKLDVPMNTMENIKFQKLDAVTKETLSGVEFDLNIVYENGKSINQKFVTNENGEYVIEKVDIPEGVTTFELKELEAKPGYVLEEETQIIEFIRNGEKLQINSTKISKSEMADCIKLEILNYMPKGEVNEKPEESEKPDVPINPNNPNIPSEPVEPDEPGISEKPEIKYDFDINIINENKYNSNLRLEGSSFNVKIKKYNVDIFNKNVTLARSPLCRNTIELKNLDYEGDLIIEIKQITAPLHHTLNLNVYRLNISRDGSIGDIYLNGTNISDDAEVIIENDNMKFDKNGNRINNVNNKIKIKIKNEPSEFMVGVTKLDAIETNIHLANAGFVLRKFVDVSLADLKTIGFIETDETGFGSTIVSEYATNTTVLYTLKEEKTPEGYENAGTAGIYITTDLNGNIINAQLSTSKMFAQTGFEIKQYEGKYIEFEVKNRRKPLPIYKIVLEDSNIENNDVKVRGAKYNVRVRQEIGAEISANISTNAKGLAEIKGLMGTRKIEILVKQIEKAQGYLIDSVEHKIVIEREVSEIIQNGEKQIIYTIKLNNETDKDIVVIIDDVEKEVIIKLENTPSLGIFIEKVDTADKDVRLNGGIFKLTTIDNNIIVETDDNGEAFIDLGRAFVNKTIKYILTEVQPPLGFKQIEPIEIIVTFNDAGKIKNVEILENRDEVYIKNRTASTFTLRIDNKEIINEQMETTFNLEIIKHNLRNDSIKVENVIFDIFVKSEDGKHKKAIKTSNSAGKINLERIKGYGKITIELTELETADGYKIDDKTRIVTLYREKVKDKDRIRLIPEETSNDLRVMIDAESQEVIVDIDNDILNNVLGLAIQKQDNIDSAKKLAEANFIIKDEFTNKKFSLITNDEGIGFVPLPFHAEPGLHSYSIKEEKSPIGYNINPEILTFQVWYNKNWEIEKVQLLNAENFASIVKVEKNYVELCVTNVAKTPIEPFELIITKADWSDYKITIPDTLLSIDVQDNEYGLNENKTENTNAEGNIYIEKLYGAGRIEIDINEIMPAKNRRFDGLNKYAVIQRNIKNGEMKIEESLNVDTIIDNENRKVQVIVRNKELPGLFTVVLDKMDKETLEKMAGVEFELQTEYSSEAIKGVTDEEGRIEFTGLEMPGLGTYKYKLKEFKTLEGYKLLDEVSFDITFKAGDKAAGEDLIIIATAELMNNKENAEIVKVLPQYVKIDIFNEKVDIEESEEDIEKPEEDIEEPKEDIEAPEEEIEDLEDIELPEENIEEKTEDVLETIFKDIENILQKEQAYDLDAFIKENFVADLKEDYFEYEEKADDDDDEKEKDVENKTIDVFNLEDDKEYIIKSATKTGFTLMLGLLILVACLFRNLEIYVLTNGEYKLVKKLRCGRFNKKVDLSKYFDEDEELNTIKLVMKNRLNKVLGGDKLEIKLQKQEFKRSVDKDEDEYIIVKTRTNREELPKEDDTELYEALDNELVEELDIEKELKDEKDNKKEDNNSK
ncbi:MAG: hypothetical protein J6J60_08245 [Clostridia bacterium]|nr:hypothetical protein [Clostridia bacterium]